jgi:membrane protease YdiL (CAAX protease family)
MGVYFGIAIIIGIVYRIVSPETAKDAAENGVPPNLLILFSVVVPLASLLSLLIGLKVLVPNGYRQVGLNGPPSPWAALGALGILVAALPLIQLASAVTQIIYERLGWPLDTHELLKSMGHVDSLGEKIMAVVAAVVIAPLNEEILFRGHIQTGIRRLLLPRPGVLLAEAVAVAVDPSLMPPPLPSEDVTLEYASPPMPVAAPVIDPVPPPPASRTLLASTIAIVVTSAIFALIHPSWSRAPIFVLSLFLGVAYERRGNLWTSIFIHALFNATMITLYLSTQQPGP